MTVTILLCGLCGFLAVCSQNMLFVEASAKTAAGVSDIFESVAAKLAGGLPVSVAARAAA